MTIRINLRPIIIAMILITFAIVMGSLVLDFFTEMDTMIHFRTEVPS